MTDAQKNFEAFCNLVEGGDPVGAIEQFYAEDATVFENRKLARAGRDQCAAHERRERQRQESPPTIKIVRRAFNPASQTGFVEYEIRFVSENGRPLRLEEVAVQRWAEGRIFSERFFYEGFVDEGD